MADLVNEDGCGPGVGRDVMDTEHHLVARFFEFQQDATQNRTACEIERALRMLCS
jgi:hypothetical protein